MSYLILMRHGESRWNISNRFTGWVDVPLSQRGLQEAFGVAEHIKSLDLTVAFTSHLKRAHQTLLSVLSLQQRTAVFLHHRQHRGMDYPFIKTDHEIPVYTSWLLNERNYGRLQGMDKNAAAKKFGLKKVLAWRRSFNARPPSGESLEDVYKRVIPYFKKEIFPYIEQKKNVLVVAHGNTLRAIIKYIDQIPDEMLPHLEVAPVRPFIYRFQRGKLVKVEEGYDFTRPISWD